MIEGDQKKLKRFRQKLYALFTKRQDAIFNLLDAVTSYGHRCNTVVQLSESPVFERQYSSITDAIADGLTQVEWRNKITTLCHQYGYDPRETRPTRFVLDCTGNSRPFARKLSDKTVIHKPNPAPGNKPIAVGHQYSVLVRLPDDADAAKKHWVLPLSAKRVKSGEKGNEVGMKQLVTHIDKLGLTDQLCISIGDSLYGTQACRILASQRKHLVHIVRLSSRRHVYSQPDKIASTGRHAGRKQEFGDKLVLQEINAKTPCNQMIRFEQTYRRGNIIGQVRCWKNKLMRGSRRFRGSQHPFHLLQITLTDETGKPVFKHALWLAVFGARRDEVSLKDGYEHYKARYDIEHFFRFGKTKLRMDAYQTMKTKHEELWWKFSLLAYTQLYLARNLVAVLPKPWERYLSVYKNASMTKTPAQTQRGYENLLRTIGTPARPCVPRGISPGRKNQAKQTKRTEQPIIFKQAKKFANRAERIFSGFGKPDDISNPQKIDQLIVFVQTSLRKMGLTTTTFSRILLDSS